MPKGVDIRPTQDKVRGAIFNILAARMAGASVLDLYAGSGAFGLEALSRDARRAVFVDNNPICINTIRFNLMGLGIELRRAEVIRSDAIKALKALDSSGERFDLVFMDPPYHKAIAKKCLLKINAYDILAPNNLIVVEHHKKDELVLASGLLSIDERRYGDIVVSFFKKESSSY
jgi:16S rRNA (guanine(966)-N(2))-methyltransferase RsmD